jgi:hypothetical protein
MQGTDERERLVIEDGRIGGESIPGLIVDVVSSCGDVLPSVRALAKALGFLHRGFAARSLVDYLKYLEIHADGNRDKIRELETRAEKVENAVSKEVLASYVLRGARKALNETRRERVERLAAVAANCTFRYEEIEPETKNEAIELCEELSERDIRVLMVLCTKERMNAKEIMREMLKGTKDGYEKLSYFNMSLEKLRARGLIMESEERVMRIQDTGGPSGPEGGYKNLLDKADNRCFEALPVGRDLLQLLLKPEEKKTISS